LVPEIIITTHKNADFDGFAACVAASLIYEDAIIVLEGEPQQYTIFHTKRKMIL